ncbi:MAG TPA: nitrate reductase subunit beta [Terriglobales bacterium]|nr:nitrate reductase subunit beta [Terriglobales bacterium]
MDVRAQIASVFHLDKCLGCHTCSVACKNIWTDREGAEYMWWNNVETKPGTGYPIAWEDQERYRGGWVNDENAPRLRGQNKLSALVNIFHNPNLPSLDDYYEPWTYEYQRLTDAPAGDDQPTARPISMVTGKYMDLKAGPNWDDDLAGSPVYAARDPNLDQLPPEQRVRLFATERLIFFHLPRTCNHCLNPACVAACPSGALHKRGEDGVVVSDPTRCRGWRHCVAACPYKKAYYNWSSGKLEKCILCFPRLESGQAPACFQSCPGRIRFVGVLLYDADRIAAVANADDKQLVNVYRDMLLDPCDPAVIAAAGAAGIHADVMQAAQRSPVYRFVKQWQLALPLHPEFRTLPSLFYVPPLSPVADGDSSDDLFIDPDRMRIPVHYLATLFAAGEDSLVSYSLRKQQAIRAYRRALALGNAAGDGRVLASADCSSTEANAIFHLTVLSAPEERFVIPPLHREMGIEVGEDTGHAKGTIGFGLHSAHGRQP